MKKQQLKLVVALAMALVLGSNAQAGSFNFDAPGQIYNSDWSLLDVGTSAYVGHFGTRNADQVAALFSEASTAGQVGSLLGSYFTSIHSPVQSTAAGLLNYNVEVADSLGNNRYMYAVLARPVGEVFELGIFAAYDFTYDDGVFNKATQISFDSGFPYLNFFTLTQSFNPDDAGFSGAAPVGDFGYVSGGNFALSELNTTSVPEPSSASLMLAGTVALFALRRLRNKNV